MKRGKEMRLSGWAGMSVERLRWGLLTGVLLLVAVLVVLMSYGRYRAVQAWKQIVKRSGATISRETDGVTYSQAVGGKTIFTLHAARAVPHGDGRYTLENGTLVLYGANGQPADRISGANFDYDEKSEVAKALGEVDMEMELPKGLSAQGSGARAQGQEGQTIHVRTSGLTYLRKLGVAATDQEVEIAYGGMHGWAKGAEFDTGQSVVHLLADVRADAQLHGVPIMLHATKADLDRDADVIDLTAPRVESHGRVATAAMAVLHLRKDGSLQTVDARGEVMLKEGTRTISAAGMHAAMNGDSRMQRADLNGGVALVDTSALRPMKGSAKTVKVLCDSTGRPTSVVAEGGAMLNAAESSPAGRSLARQMGADRITLTLVKAAHGGTRVSAVHAEGNAWASGDAIARAKAKQAGIKTTRIAGDDLRLALVRDAAGKDEPQSMSGSGHTRIEQRMPDGTVETSSGNALQAAFETVKSGSGVEIASAEQKGHVEIHGAPGKAGEQPSEGVAERAELDGASDVLTLSGHPRLTRGDTSVSAETIRLMQSTGDAVAEGDVAATLVNAKAKPGAPVTHALAQQATLRRAAETVEFTGTDTSPAKMWQGASQVEAANLLLDRAKDSMQAWPGSAGGVVRAVFAGQRPGSRVQGPEGRGGGGPRGGGPRTKGEKASGLELKGDRVVRVTSKRLNYSGASHEAVFTGGVVAQGEDGLVRGQRGVAFLSQGPGPRAQGPEGQRAREPEDQQAKGQPDMVGASVEKIVLSGGVKVQQPDRVAAGDQLLYTAATGEFVLTGTPGHPPHVVDDKQGSITGETLLFHSPDSTIVVEGSTKGVPGSGRVHTETTIRK